MQDDSACPGTEEILFEDIEGPAASEWTTLPPQREFFASPYDPPVKTLVAEMADGELIARPSFQRNASWDRKRKSKFVESILLNIPIPNLFFAEDDDGSKVVVDGQQRLLALRDYIAGDYGLLGLEVLHQLNGMKYESLTERQQRIISNRTLRCLVISARSDSEIRFEVFERLNTGGVPLNAQEVRHCVYRGDLNDLLHELAEEPRWLALINADTVDSRMRDCELILRFFAIKATLPEYAPPLKKLLNEFMKVNRKLSESRKGELRDTFLSAVDAVSTCFGDNPFRRSLDEKGVTTWERSLNRAVFDTQMILLEDIDKEWTKANAQAIQSQFIELCRSDNRFNASLTKATANKSNMDYRLATWKVALDNIGAPVRHPERVPAMPSRDSIDAE